MITTMVIAAPRIDAMAISAAVVAMAVTVVAPTIVSAAVDRPAITTIVAAIDWRAIANPIDTGRLTASKRGGESRDCRA
jgi:hypothetical protein